MKDYEEELKPRQAHSVMVVCSECGKDVYIPFVPLWTYKKVDNYEHKIKYFCGWNCMRKFEREYDDRKKRKRLNRVNPNLKRCELKNEY